MESGAFASTLAVRSSNNPKERLRIASALIARLGEAQDVFMTRGTRCSSSHRVSRSIAHFPW